MKHSAQTSSGSSGSAILNEDFEIIGINIGGSGLKMFNTIKIIKTKVEVMLDPF